MIKFVLSWNTVKNILNGKELRNDGSNRRFNMFLDNKEL